MPTGATPEIKLSSSHFPSTFATPYNFSSFQSRSSNPNSTQYYLISPKTGTCHTHYLWSDIYLGGSILFLFSVILILPGIKSNPGLLDSGLLPWTPGSDIPLSCPLEYVMDISNLELLPPNYFSSSLISVLPILTTSLFPQLFRPQTYKSSLVLPSS